MRKMQNDKFQVYSTSYQAKFQIQLKHNNNLFSDMKCLVDPDLYRYEFKNCNTCLIKGICRNCATHCHQGHYVVQYKNEQYRSEYYRGECNCKHKPPSSDFNTNFVSSPSDSQTSTLLVKQNNMEVCQAAIADGNVSVHFQ